MTSAGVPPPQFAPSAPDGRTPTDLSAPTAHKEKSAANLGGFAPPKPPGFIAVFCQSGWVSFLVISACRTMEGLDRRIGQRRDATRAPNQARSGWRPSGRLLGNPLHHLRTGQIPSNQRFHNFRKEGPAGPVVYPVLQAHSSMRICSPIISSGVSMSCHITQISPN